ncbi:RNA-directed DNA polymerase, eukaryota [Tanacetum coccineum]
MEARKAWIEKENKLNSILIQKPRIKWDFEGDENSRFFHNMVKRRCDRNSIRGLMIDSMWCEDPQRIKGEIFRFYKGIFSASDRRRPRFVNNRVPKLSIEDALCLEVSFSKSKVWNTVCGCRSDKAPGPDGFNFKYIKRFWDVIKVDVLRAVRWFWEKGEFYRGCNASFVTLIPKVVDPIGLGDYRPISIIGSFYKIITKILSERVKRLIGKIVGELHMLSLRVDIFWMEFLLQTRRWTAEGLSALLREAIEKNIFTGIRVGEDEVSGLKINLRKSKVYGVGVESEELDRMARFMTCGVGELPFTYLGLPIGVNMRRVSAWNGVIDRFKARLSEWKARAMSFGGRLTLVKSVLGSLPLYYFSMFRVPSSVILALERLYWDSGGGGFEQKEDLFGVELLKVFMGLMVGGVRAVEDLGDLEELLKEVSLSEYRRDGWKWRLDPNEVFHVRSLSHWIEERRASRMLWVNKIGWINVIPRKVNVFVWRAVLGRLPVRVELDKRGIDIDSILCPCCENVVELIDHNLVLCEKALKVWDKIFACLVSSFGFGPLVLCGSGCCCEVVIVLYVKVHLSHILGYGHCTAIYVAEVELASIGVGDGLWPAEPMAIAIPKAVATPASLETINVLILPSRDEERTSEDAVKSPYIGIIWCKGITRLLLLGALDIIQGVDCTVLLSALTLLENNGKLAISTTQGARKMEVKPPILFLSGQLHEMIPPVYMQMLYANAAAHNRRCSISD